MVLWLAVLVFLVLVREVLVPFWLAVAFTYVIDPIVTWLSARRIGQKFVPRWAAVAIIYLVIFCVGWLTAVYVVPQLYREVKRLAREGTQFVETIDEAKIDEWSTSAEELFERFRLPIRVKKPGNESGPPASADMPKAETALITIDVADIAQETLESAQDFFRTEIRLIFDRVQGFVKRIFSTVFSFFLILMLTAFLSNSREQVRRSIFTLVPKEHQTAFAEFLGRVGKGLSGVVRGQLTICLINGLLTLVGLLILRVKFAFILATLATVFSLIPVFGSILSTIPIVLVALAQGPLIAILSVGWILLIHSLEANLLNPKIMGDAAKIHPVLIVLALVVGEHYYGLIGALFAVPVASILLTVYRSLQSVIDDYDERIETALPRRTLSARKTLPRPPSERNKRL